MNTILLKVQQYLDSVSKKPAELNSKLVDEFGEACKNALLKQFQEDRRSKFEIRMSNAGRPLCQLQMEAKGCLLYTSDAADDQLGVDLGGRRIIKKKFFKAEDGIRDLLESRGLGDVYKRQVSRR